MNKVNRKVKIQIMYIVLYNEQITYTIKLTEGKLLKFFNRRISVNRITCKFTSPFAVYISPVVCWVELQP